MFYDTFDKLCKAKGTSPSAVCIAIGLSRTTSAYWKRTGSTPKREALEKIADYLSVPMDYLLERETKNASDQDVRSAIIDRVMMLTDSQAKHLLALLETMVE